MYPLISRSLLSTMEADISYVCLKMSIATRKAFYFDISQYFFHLFYLLVQNNHYLYPDIINNTTIA